LTENSMSDVGRPMKVSRESDVFSPMSLIQSKRKEMMATFSLSNHTIQRRSVMMATFSLSNHTIQRRSVIVRVPDE
jgi:hypothetical protein